MDTVGWTVTGKEIDLAYIIVKASEIVSFQVARDLLPTSLA